MCCMLLFSQRPKIVRMFMYVLTFSKHIDENAGLTLNVWVPEGTKPGDDLPVVAVRAVYEELIICIILMDFLVDIRR